MAEKQDRTISEMMADSDLITKAIAKGVRDALLSHAQVGNPVPINEDGKLIWLSPEEIYRRLGIAAPAKDKAS